MTDEEMRERFAPIFAGLSDRDIQIFEGGSMAKETEKKAPPGFENFSEADKQTFLKQSEVLERTGIVEKGDGSQAGGHTHYVSAERARVRELPGGRGGPDGSTTNTVEFDPNKPAPRIDLADHKAEFSHATTPTLSDKHPEVKKAYEEAEKLQGKEGHAAEKGQDQSKRNEGKENGRDI